MNWEYEWTCSCGKRYYYNIHRQFLIFGWHRLCKKCGKDIGSQGDDCIKRESVCYVRKIPFNLFNYKTWFVGFKRTVKP